MVRIHGLFKKRKIKIILIQNSTEMKSKKYQSIVLFTLLLLFSCSKIDETSNEFNINKSKNLKKVTEFSLSSELAREVFYGFASEVNDKDRTKNIIIPQDRTIDEAIWLLGALINRSYGFKNDSIEYLVIDTISLKIPIKSFNSEGMPIIDGSVLLSEYNEIEANIIANIENDFVFWSIALIAEDYNENEVEVSILSAGGPKSTVNRLITPTPPGTPMPLFDVNDWLWAGNSPEYPGGGVYHPQSMRANYRYFEKMSQGSPHYFDPEYVYTYYYTQFKSAYPSAGSPELRIFWDYGMCGMYQMNGATLNQFLVSTKAVIDEMNPPYHGHQDLVIGWFYIYCWDIICYDPPCPNPINVWGSQTWFTHRYVGQVYRRTYVGGEE